jgi:hypothetical protein
VLSQRLSSTITPNWFLQVIARHIVHFLGARQELEPLDPIHDRDHGPLPPTAVGVPVAQRLVVGNDVVSSP